MEILKLAQQIKQNVDPSDIQFNHQLFISQPILSDDLTNIVNVFQYPNYNAIMDSKAEQHMLVSSINLIFNLKVNYQILISFAQLLNSKVKSHSCTSLWQILYLVAISKVWSALKKTDLEIATQEMLRKSKNILEQDFKLVMHDIMQDLNNQDNIKYLNYAIIINPTIFRNYTRQIQEKILKMNQLPEEQIDLFAILMLTYLESKQGAHSYQNQLKIGITSLLDVINICSTYLYEKQPNIIQEDLKKNMENREGKFSIYFILVEPIYKDGKCLNKQIHKCCLLLQSLLKFTKDETQIELNFQMMLKNIQESLLQNHKYFDLFTLLDNKNQGSIAQKSLQNIINNLVIDKNVQFNLDEFIQNQNDQFCKLLDVIQILFQSPLSSNLICYCSEIQQLLNQLIQNSYIRTNSTIAIKLNHLIHMFTQLGILFMLFMSLDFPMNKVIFNWCSYLIDELQLKFVSYFKLIQSLEKQNRTSGFVNKSVQSKGTSISLGLKCEHEYSIETLCNHIETGLMILESHSEYILNCRIDNQLIANLLKLIIKIPNKNLNEKMQLYLLNIMYQVIDYLPYSQQFEFNQIQVITNFIKGSEEIDGLKKLCKKIVHRIHLVKQVMKWSILDNHYTAINQLHDMINSQEQFQNQIQDQNEFEPNKIKKVKSLLVEEQLDQQSNKQSEDIYYSIKEVNSALKVDEELPKAVFD